MKLKTAPIKLKSKGYFSLAVYKADGSEVTEKRVSNTENVVTYSGAYNLFFEDEYRNLTSRMKSQVGTGTTELTRASSGLTSLLATTSTDSSDNRSNEVSNEDGTATHTATRTNSFSLGAVVGTISEVGLITNASSLFIAGQLIKDEFGAPTTLTILADEQLVVSYTLVLTYPNGSGSISQGAPLVGSGSVTTPTATSTYNMYAQPLFCDYANAIGQGIIRAESARGVYLMHDSAGDLFSEVFSDTTSISPVHDGTTGVTLDFNSATAAPTDFNSTGIKFISAGATDQVISHVTINPTTKLAISQTLFYARITLVAEFTPALTKTSSESMTINMTMAFEI